MLEKGSVPVRYWKNELLYLGGTDGGKPKVVLQEVLQRKTFFSQNDLCQNLLDM